MPQQNNSRTNRKAAPAAPQTDNFGRLQPQDRELERAVLGALLIEQEAYYRVSEILTPDCFYEHRHQLIYEAIQRLNFQQNPVDILTVTHQLEEAGNLEEAGGPFYLTELSEMMYSSAHIEYHARIIADKAMARRIITLTSEVQRDAFDPTHPADEVMKKLEAQVFALGQDNSKNKVEQIDSILDDAMDAVQRASANTDAMTGIPSGFTELDKITNGWQKSDLIIIGARPAMGKTAFALSMAKNMAVDMKRTVAVFSLEMSKMQLVNRVLSNVCEIDSSQLRTGQLKSFEWEQLDANYRRMLGTPLYIDDTANMSVFELQTKARRLCREKNVEIIIIDYLQLMTASGLPFNSRQEEISIISRSLKGLAKELNIPIIALSQLSRESAKREGDDKRPQLSDLRESGAIEQDADIVTFIHRPEYYHIYQSADGTKDLHGKAEIIIAKHRNGAVGDILLNFQGKYARFENEEKGYIPVPGEKGITASGEMPPGIDIVPPSEGFPMSDNSDPFAPLPPGTDLGAF